MSFEERLRAEARRDSGAEWVAIEGDFDVDPDELALPAGDRFCLWDTRPRADLAPELAVGIGASISVESEGVERGARARGELATLRARIERRDARVRAFGGLAFEPGQRGAFGAFGDLSLLVPRWTFTETASARRVLLVARAAELREPEILLEELCRVTCPVASPRRPRRALALEDAGDREFMRAVERAIQAISASSLDKVVVVRRVGLRGEVAPHRVLAELAGESGCIRFAFGRAGAVFAGATPELLVTTDGQCVRSEAVAGTESREFPPARLLESEKDRREHEYVVRDIRARLVQEGIALDPIRSAEVRTLRHVHHLVTPITGRASERRHALDLALALHPTPAVLGLPRARAREFLAREESFERGWFASPVGWVGLDGDGAFAVALRSLLIEPGRTWLFAGAGIVQGSSPERELRETQAKLSGALGALGSPTTPPSFSRVEQL